MALYVQRKLPILINNNNSNDASKVFVLWAICDKIPAENHFAKHKAMGSLTIPIEKITKTEEKQAILEEKKDYSIDDNSNIAWYTPTIHHYTLLLAGYICIIL